MENLMTQPTPDNVPYTILFRSNLPDEQSPLEPAVAVVNGETVYYDVVTCGATLSEARKKAAETLESSRNLKLSQFLELPSDQVTLKGRPRNSFPRFTSRILPDFWQGRGYNSVLIMEIRHTPYKALSHTPAGTRTTVPTETPYRPGDLSGLATVAAKAFTKG